MSGLSLPRQIDRIGITYDGERSVYRVERLRKTEAVMFREVAEADGATVSDVAMSARPMLAERVIDVTGFGAEHYPGDRDGRLQWWEEMRTDYEAFALGRLMLDARVGNLRALSFDGPSSPSRSQRTPAEPTQGSSAEAVETTSAPPGGVDSSTT